jgi:hypothetical protein
MGLSPLETREGAKLMHSTLLQNALWTLSFPWHRTRWIQQAGGEVARECRAELWQRVRQSALGMSAPELRGYARAHATVVAATQVDQVLARRSLRPSLHGPVLASSVDQLVAMAIHDALSEIAPAEARPLAA